MARREYTFRIGGPNQPYELLADTLDIEAMRRLAGQYMGLGTRHSLSPDALAAINGPEVTIEADRSGSVRFWIDD